MLSLPVDVYRRPCEGTDVDTALMQAYLDREHGLVSQLERDFTHGWTVLVPYPPDRQVGARRLGDAQASQAAT